MRVSISVWSKYVQRLFRASATNSRRRREPARRRNYFSFQTHVEVLEVRSLLTGVDFELSSLLPAYGGNGSSGFVVNGITEQGKLGGPGGYQPLGDVNQDGMDDFFLASTGSKSLNQIGQVYLVFGRADGFPAELDLQTLDGTNGYVIDGAQIGESTGGNGGGAGDVNHDGFPDLAIGAPLADPSDRFNAGQTFVVYGGLDHLAQSDLADGTPDGHFSLAGLDGTHGFVINGVAIESYSGNVSAVGDVNGDLVDDLVIGSGGAGAVNNAYVVFGRGQGSTAGASFPAILELSTLDGAYGFTIPELVSTNSLGSAVGGRGDFNGDGTDDIVLGDYYASPSGRTQAGQTYVIFGRTSFPSTFDLASLNGSNGFTVNGKKGNDLLGSTMAGVAGDVNGDGVDDVMISAWMLDGPTGADLGGGYIIFGKNTALAGAFPAVLEVSTLNGSDGFVMYGVSANDFAKYGSAAGDVNGDGYDDVIISSSTVDANGISNAGQSYIVYGRSSFAPSLQLSSLLAVNGGDGSLGYVLNGFVSSTSTAGSANVAGLGDINHDGFADVRIASIFVDSNGLTDNGQAYIIYGKASPPMVTKFYVVNDATQNQTYEYNVGGGSVESYSLNSGNTAPRGAASTIAGDKTWIVDANRNVYVYNTSGGLLGSWTAGTLTSTADPQGITTNGTDVWIVDNKSDKVYKYAGAATRLSGSQNAASSFSLNGSNTSPKDLVTNGTSIWVVNDSLTDKVFKYTVAGSLQESWTISTSGASSPTGITINPANVSDIWIVDSGTDTVYQYTAAATLTSGSQAAAANFALTAGNTNPQGIADPPAPSILQHDNSQVPASSQAVAIDFAMGQLLDDSGRGERGRTFELGGTERSQPRTASSPTNRSVEFLTIQAKAPTSSDGQGVPQAKRLARATDDVFATWNRNELAERDL